MARAEFDRGVVNEGTQLQHMVFQLKPSEAQQAELDALVEAQHDPQSPLYHQWLTPAQYGARFGASGQDRTADRRWIFAARIVVGDNHGVGKFLDDRAHLRPFAGIAIAAATEDSNQLTRVRKQGSRRFQYVFKPVRSMGVINNAKGLSDSKVSAH